MFKEGFGNELLHYKFNSELKKVEAKLEAANQEFSTLSSAMLECKQILKELKNELSSIININQEDLARVADKDLKNSIVFGTERMKILEEEGNETMATIQRIKERGGQVFSEIQELQYSAASFQRLLDDIQISLAGQAPKNPKN